MEAIAATLPIETQSKFIELKDKFNFDLEELEAFKINQNGTGLNSLNIADFEGQLERGAAKKAKKQAAADKFKAANVTRKRKEPENKAPNKAGPLDAFAVSMKMDMAVTPSPKRQREGDLVLIPADGVPTQIGGLGQATPEALPRHTAVTLKSSVNDKLAGAPAEGAKSSARVEHLGDKTWWLGKRGEAYAWMDETIESRALAADTRLSTFEKRITAHLCEKHGEDVVEGALGDNSSTEVALCGRIICEDEGKLNERSVMLEGSRGTSNAHRIRLTTGECREVSIIPGQIVGVVGRSSASGRQFNARDFVGGLPVATEEAAQRSAGAAGDAPLHIITAAGPFCLRDGLDYAPLEGLFRHAMLVRPQALILMGPFVDVNNMRVKEGDCTAPGSTSTRTLEEVYITQVLPLLSSLCLKLKQASSVTEIMIVPSLEEALVFHPLPQPPLDLSLCLEGDALSMLKRTRVQFLSNPAHIQIDNAVLCVSSADALSPVLRDLVLRKEGAKRIEEALRLLLQQRTLFPACPHDPSQVSESLADAIGFPTETVPDVCVFPSLAGIGSGSFVEGCLFVNPGPLCRATLGTFAEIVVHPGTGPMEERIRVDIQKLG